MAKLAILDCTAERTALLSGRVNETTITENNKTQINKRSLLKAQVKRYTYSAECHIVNAKEMAYHCHLSTI